MGTAPSVQLLATTTRHTNQLGGMANAWSLSEDGSGSVSEIADFLVRQNATLNGKGWGGHVSELISSHEHIYHA
jgi:hypothetical protein